MVRLCLLSLRARWRTLGQATASLRHYKLEEGNYLCEKLCKLLEKCRKRSVYGDVTSVDLSRSLTFSTGKLANLADGSVVVQASLDFEVGSKYCYIIVLLLMYSLLERGIQTMVPRSGRVFSTPAPRGGVLTGIFGKGGSADSTKPWPCSRHRAVNLPTLSKRKCCNFLPCSRLDKALPYSKQ